MILLFHLMQFPSFIAAFRFSSPISSIIAPFSACKGVSISKMAHFSTHAMSNGDNYSEESKAIATIAKEAQQEQEQEQQKREQRPLLIDVDCNLLHKDMISLGLFGILGMNLGKIGATEKEKGQETEEDDTLSSISNTLNHASMKQSNIVAIFSPTSTIAESHKSINAFSKLDKSISLVEVKTSVGVHPYHTRDEGHPPSLSSHYINNNDNCKVTTLIERGIATKNIVSSIGECGLDYSDGFPPSEYQIPWFNYQLDLAYKFNLPIFLHERNAFHDVIDAIDSAHARNGMSGATGLVKSSPKIVVHCFTGTSFECQEYVSRGYCIGITGHILKKPTSTPLLGENGPNTNNENTNDNRNEVWQCLRKGIIPLDKLMIETDAPYMGFDHCRDLHLEFEQDVLTKLNGKKRKQVFNSFYPNVPSSLPLILSAVTNAINEGRKEREESTLLTEYEVGCATTRNAIDFFGFEFSEDVIPRI